MSPSNALVAGALRARGSRTNALSLSPVIAKLLVLLVQIPLSYAAPLFPRALRALEEEPPKSPDDPDLWVYLGVAVVLVLLGGAFAGLTIALMGQDEIYLQVISESGEGSEKKYAKRVLNLLKKGKHWVLVTLLLSNVITNETLPIVLDRSLGGGWPAVVSSTVLIVIFGEVAPQSICVRYGLPIGAFMSPVVLLLMWVMAPVAWPTAKLLDYLLGEDHGTTYKKAGLKTLVTLHKSLGSATERLNEDEVTIISAVLDLKDKSVGDIMTPMGDVFTMSADTVLDEKMMDTILSQGYSRIPVYAPENPRNFIGMLLVKILITYDPEDCLRVRDFALATLPETAPHTSCLDIVNFFQEGKSHMVLVSDFPGQDRGALGVLTLEDVIEELIGEEIIDESDVFVDVHRAIRRVQPAPRMKYNRDVSRDTNKDKNQADTELESEAEASETDGLLGKKPPSRKASLNEPRETTFLMRRASDGSSREQRPPVAVRSNTQDLRSHLRHLGPSNVASRPKSTKYTSVKIKPGVGTIPEGGVPSDTPNTDTPRSVSGNGTAGPDGGAGAGLVRDAAGDAKDGVVALAQGYGTMGNGEPIRIEPEQQLSQEIHAEGGSSPNAPKSAAEASALAAESAKQGRTVSPERTEDDSKKPQEQEPEEPIERKPSPPAPEKLVVPSGDSRPASQDGRRRRDSESSNASQSTVGELHSHPQKPKRNTRSGSITESVVDVGGMKKVVLETTSSSDAEGEGHKSGDGANGDDANDNDDAHADGGNENGASKKKKKKKRGGRKAREREARKNGSGDSTPVLK
ncbi:hypothetical protein MBLNU457_4353t1 [Dothideomycetes sp. NU457]